MIVVFSKAFYLNPDLFHVARRFVTETVVVARSVGILLFRALRVVTL